MSQVEVGGEGSGGRKGEDIDKQDSENGELCLKTNGKLLMGLDDTIGLSF